MKTVTGLTVIALGAILAFALTKQPSFLDLHVVGWVLMLTGAVGLAVPRAKHGRLRRRTVWRGEHPEQEIEIVETDVEPKFSQGVPGGLVSRLCDTKLAHEQLAGHTPANGTTKRHSGPSRSSESVPPRSAAPEPAAPEPAAPEPHVSAADDRPSRR